MKNFSDLYKETKDYILWYRKYDLNTLLKQHVALRLHSHHSPIVSQLLMFNIQKSPRSVLDIEIGVYYFYIVVHNSILIVCIS